MSSILSGLFSGRSGIQSHGTAISVLADNIANQNTIGYKAGRADFVDLLAGSLGDGGRGASSVGSGSAVKNVTRVMSQGTFEPTGRGLDLAIDGNGFLVVQDQSGVTYFTRAGNLSVDSDGNLLDQNKNFVMGYSATGSGAITKINVTEKVAGNVNTTRASATGNLDARAAISVDNAGTLGANVPYMDLNNADVFSMPVNTFDTLGVDHTLRVSYFKTGSNTWQAAVYADGGEVDLGTPGEAHLLGSMTLSFNSSGQLTTTPPTLTVNPAWNNGSTQGVPIEINFGGFTQSGTNSSLDSLSRNGTGTGSVVGYTFGENGDLIAQLDNGQTSVIGTIALATFANPEGLQRVGNSLYIASVASGETIMGRPGVGTFGSIASGSLEMSTADMASDFIKLISLQRGFQGSSRVIGSISDLLNEVVNLAR